MDPMILCAIQMLLGLAAAVTCIGLRGLRWVLTLEERFIGLRRVLVAVSLLLFSVSSMFSIKLWSNLPLAPLVFLAVGFWIVSGWLGLELLVWMPLGGLSKVKKAK
jgi:hypothetical protein